MKYFSYVCIMKQQQQEDGQQAYCPGMIPERFNTTDDRDPEKYLGIDGSVIPWKYFKGVFTDDNTIIFTDDPYSGIQFYASQDGKGCGVVTNNSNQYVTKEDLENDYWLLIGHALMEITQPWITQFLNTAYTEAQTKLHRKYNNGESGLIKEEVKKFNEKGEYMISRFEFDTRPILGENIQQNLLRHIEFIYRNDIEVPMMERRSVVVTNSENIKALKEIMVKPQFEMMKENGMLPETLNQEFEKLNFTQVHFPPYGSMEFIEDNSVEDFIVTKNKDGI